MFFLLFSPHYVGNYACLCGVGARKIIGQYKSWTDFYLVLSL